MKNILLIEDSKEIFRMVSQAIKPISTVTWAETISTARENLTKNSYDLILIDVELPDGNGIELCNEISANFPLVPIFFLSSHSELSEKVLGFSAGADDYITKPFEPLELKARIEARLKKTEAMSEVGNHLNWKEIKIDKAKQKVEILRDDNYETIDLTALEFKLLLYFANQPEVVIERDRILDDLWGEEVHVYSRSVDTHVSKLRKKLDCVSDIIKSIHGAGYKFSPTKKLD